jgi:predicted RND superfamily exporter protein
MDGYCSAFGKNASHLKVSRGLASWGLAFYALHPSMSIYRSIAQQVIRRPAFVFAASTLFVVGCLLIAVFGCRFDSEILNMLPGGFESVQTLKLYNENFTDSKQLTFALVDEDHSSDLDGFRDHFAEEIKKEPWALRVMARSPMDSANGLDELKSIALPLLLNIEPQNFAEVIKRLEPDRIRERLTKYHAAMESGSPRAEIELNVDPLGVVFPALKPLSSTFTEEQSDPLTSPDGTTRLIFVVTNLEDLSAPTCQKTMAQVEAFEKRLIASWPGKAPQIMVTGRTAYVAEMSHDMRRDITMTVFGSLALVGIIFYVGFRRLRPLMAIMHVLALCCIVAIGLGGLIFRELSMITIGCCSILVGLGVDFGMLLYGSYQTGRNSGLDHDQAVVRAVEQIGRGVFFGALTTAAGFLSLGLSECNGFAQLGALIAIGVMFSALFMMTVFFVMIGKAHVPVEKDWLFSQTQRYVGFLFKHTKPVLLVTTLILVTLTAIGFSPLGKLQFLANPRALEPKNSKAGLALRTIQKKMPAAEVEPLLVLSEATDAENFQERWNRLNQSWQKLKAEGGIRNFTSPAPFALSPQRIKANTAVLRGYDFNAIRQTLSQTLEQEGFKPAAFEGAFSLLTSLQEVANGNRSLLDWRKNLPEESPWWFMLNRFFSSNPKIGAAYVSPNHTVANNDERLAIREKLNEAGVPIRITGWSYALAELAPWSKDKLYELSIVMVLFNIVLLIFLYRAAFPLLVLMLGLFLSIGAMIASLKFFAIPLNLFNVLAFPLVLGVGVDYGIYVILALRQGGDREMNLSTIIKPVLMSGLTTLAGFGSLGLAQNPSLSGLGTVCAFGVGWSLVATIFFILPAYLWKGIR